LSQTFHKNCAQMHRRADSNKRKIDAIV